MSSVCSFFGPPCDGFGKHLSFHPCNILHDNCRDVSRRIPVTEKLFKIDGYMLRGVWQALNCLFIHATFCVIDAGASPGQTKNEGRGIRKNDDFLQWFE